ncbi:MAG: alanine--tRNA ligase, partial [Candidatus Omnitrophica bacterium]|nr:alanine--tRNA ligase [Candidatus Omnitrophota bacterium]
ITKVIDDLDMNLLRQNVDSIKAKVKNSVILLCSASGNRALMVMGVTRDLCDKGLDASKLIRDISGIIGGSGGGREDFAQAGGDEPGKFAEAFNQLKKLIKGQK